MQVLRHLGVRVRVRVRARVRVRVSTVCRYCATSGYASREMDLWMKVRVRVRV